MKLSIIFALIAFVELVKGTWWAIAVQPVILSIGAIISALREEDQEIMFDFRKPVKSKKPKWIRKGT